MEARVQAPYVSAAGSGRRRARPRPIGAHRTISTLHVAQPLDGGVLRVAADLVADQIGRGWSVSVACPPESQLAGWAADVGARVLSWPAVRAPGRSLPAEVRRLAAIVAAESPDLVHLHSAKAGLAGRLALRGGRPTVFQPHAWSFEAASGLMSAGAGAWERWATRWADVIVCVSADERRRAEGAGIHGRFAEIPNGVDLSRYTPAGEKERLAARRALGLENGPLAVVVGRLAEQKGQDDVLRVWPTVLASVPEAELWLVGDGPDRTRLQRTAPPRVGFAGARRDVATWLAAANVLVAPSRWEAGGSLAIIEAMARGRSVIATDVAGLRETVSGCGAIVAPGSDERLAEAVVERLRRPAVADREGAQARRRVEQTRDLTQATARMADMYLEVLRRRRSQGR